VELHLRRILSYGRKDPVAFENDGGLLLDKCVAGPLGAGVGGRAGNAVLVQAVVEVQRLLALGAVQGDLRSVIADQLAAGRQDEGAETGKLGRNDGAVRAAALVGELLRGCLEL